MIKIWIVHFEWHRRSSGSNRRFPRLYIYRMPRHGDRVMDGGVMGTLIACQACSGVGLLHDPDEFTMMGMTEDEHGLQAVIHKSPPRPHQGPHCKHYGGTDPCPPDAPDWMGPIEGHANLGGPSMGRRND